MSRAAEHVVRPAPGDPKVLVVSPESSVHLTRTPGQIPDLRRHVGGSPAVVRLRVGAMWFDVDAKRARKPLNVHATRLAYTLGWTPQGADFLAGTVLFADTPGPQGEIRAVPDSIVTASMTCACSAHGSDAGSGPDS